MEDGREVKFFLSSASKLGPEALLINLPLVLLAWREALELPRRKVKWAPSLRDMFDVDSPRRCLGRGLSGRDRWETFSKKGVVL